MTLLRRFLEDDAGATAIEYTLIATLMSAAVIAGIGLFKDDLLTALGNIGTIIKTETAPK